MPKSTTNLRLAQTLSDYKELTIHAHSLCDKLTHHGESNCADALFELIELLTDTLVDASDREGLSFDCLMKVFPQTTEGHKAMENAVRAINPNIAKRKAA